MNQLGHIQFHELDEGYITYDSTMKYQDDHITYGWMNFLCYEIRSHD